MKAIKYISNFNAATIEIKKTEDKESIVFVTVFKDDHPVEVEITIWEAKQLVKELKKLIKEVE